MSAAFKSLCSGFLLVALADASQAQTLDDAKLDRLFDRVAEKNKGMGSLVLARDGDVVYARQIGYGRIEGAVKEPLTAASRFRVGSIAKMFTGVMVLQLVEQGKLKLDDALDAYFPSVPNAKAITIAHLLGHRSGIFNVTENRDYRSLKTKPTTPGDMVALIAGGKPDFEPGAREAYSNSNYVLLGYIVEKVAGKPYQDVLAERITGPLHLKDTYFATGTRDAANHEVASYRYVRDWERMDETHMSVPGGAGAIVSTPADLAAFIEGLFDLKLVSKQTLDRMMKEKLAIQSFPLDGETFYGHGGSIDGFRSRVAYLPKEKLAIAWTSNGSVYPTQDLIGGVFAIYRNKPFEIPTFDAFVVRPETLDKYVGVYASPKAPVKFKIIRDGAALSAGPEGRPSLPFTATAENEFKLEGSMITLEFDVAKKQMIMRRPGRETVFTKEM
jgi:D-alanyl-D-alanine carboxypeptidase